MNWFYDPQMVFAAHFDQLFFGDGGGQGGTYILELEIACAHWPNTRTLVRPLKKCSLLASLMNP